MEGYKNNQISLFLTDFYCLRMDYFLNFIVVSQFFLEIGHF